MEIVDFSKAVRRRDDRRRHDARRVNQNENPILARIANLQRTLDARARMGDCAGFSAGRRELCDLIFTVVCEENESRKRN